MLLLWLLCMLTDLCLSMVYISYCIVFLVTIFITFVKLPISSIESHHTFCHLIIYCKISLIGFLVIWLHLFSHIQFLCYIFVFLFLGACLYASTIHSLPALACWSSSFYTIHWYFAIAHVQYHWFSAAVWCGIYVDQLIKSLNHF